MTYTKGPWSITKLERSGGLFVTDENEASVCDLYFVDNPDGTIIKHINAEANAHLIAAAPDMLEALNDSLMCFQQLVGGHEGPLISHIKGVIAKAEGK